MLNPTRVLSVLVFKRVHVCKRDSNCGEVIYRAGLNAVCVTRVQLPLLFCLAIHGSCWPGTKLARIKNRLQCKCRLLLRLCPACLFKLGRQWLVGMTPALIKTFSSDKRPTA